MKAFEIELSEGTEKMIKEIERISKKSVSFVKEKTNMPSAEELASAARDNGYVVIADPSYSPTEEDIHHEVWHLLIKAKTGIKNYNVRGVFKEYLKEFLDSDKEFEDVWSEWYSIIQHYYFFPEMVKDGYTPYKYYEDKFEEGFMDLVDTKEEELTKIYTLKYAIAYVQLSICKNHKNSKADTFMRVLEQNFPSSISIGKSLLNILSSYNDLNNESGVMKDSLKCLFSYNKDLFIIVNGEEIIIIDKDDEKM